MKNMWMFGITGLGMFVSGCLFEPKQEPIEPEEGNWRMVVVKAEASAGCNESGEEFIGETLDLLLQKSDEGSILITLEDIEMEAQIEDNIIKASGSQGDEEDIGDDPTINQEEDEEDEEEAEVEEEEEQEETEEEEIEDLEQEEIEEIELPNIAIELEGQLIEANEMEGKLLVEMKSAEQTCSLDLDFFASVVDADQPQEDPEGPQEELEEEIEEEEIEEEQEETEEQ